MDIELSKTAKFEKWYNNQPEKVKELFMHLIEKIEPYCYKHFPTDTPDYRLQKGVNFCIITFLKNENAIRIHLRTDELHIISEILEVRELKNHHYNGKVWIEIKVIDEDEIGEAVELIKRVFEFSK